MYIREGKISESDFDRWDTECDNLLDMFDTYAIDDLSYIVENIEEDNQNYGNGWTRYTDDYNERLNRLITYQMVRLKLPKSFIYKYSLCPNKVEEWEKDRDEQLWAY